MTTWGARATRWRSCARSWRCRCCTQSALWAWALPRQRCARAHGAHPAPLRPPALARALTHTLCPHRPPCCAPCFRACCCTAPLARARRCLRVPWPTARTPASSASLAASSFKSTWARARAWCGSCFRLRAQRRRALCFLMRWTPLGARGTAAAATAATARCSAPCWRLSTSWMALRRAAMSRCSWPPTGPTRWTLRCCARGGWTAKLSSPRPTAGRSASFSRRAPSK